MEARTVAKIFSRALWLTALVVVGSAFFWDLPIFLGALVGGGLALANLYSLRRIVEAGQAANTRRQAFLTVMFMAKFGAMIVCVYFAVVHGADYIDMASFLVGITAALAGLIVESVRLSFQSFSSAN